MDQLIKQQRVRVSGSERTHSSDTIPRTKSSWLTDSSAADYKVPNWLQKPFTWRMNGEHYDPQESEFASAVAAAAFAINTMEEEERRRVREELEKSRAKIKSKKHAETSRLSSVPAETSKRNLSSKDRVTASSKRSYSSAARPVTPRVTPASFNAAEREADSWERAQLDKIKKRHEKLTASILAWENKKKVEARQKMEKIKKELEKKRERNHTDYLMKVARIVNIAGGARAQADEKRRNEEAEVKEKAKEMRRTGNVPVTCCCFHRG